MNNPGIYICIFASISIIMTACTYNVHVHIIWMETGRLICRSSISTGDNLVMVRIYMYMYVQYIHTDTK